MPSGYYYDSSPDGEASSSAGGNDALTISSTANTVAAADSNASSPPYDSSYAHGSQLPNQRKQRLIFPPPPSAPPPLLPPGSPTGSRFYACGGTATNADDAYQCTDSMMRHPHHHYTHHHCNYTTSTCGHLRHYAPLPPTYAAPPADAQMLSQNCGTSTSLESPIYKSAGTKSGAKFALLKGKKYSPASDSTFDASSSSAFGDICCMAKRSRRACRSPKSNDVSPFVAIFRIAPKTTVFACASFLLLIIALIYLCKFLYDADERCHYDSGWEKEFAERAICQPDPTCSGHGICHEGQCFCASKYWGGSCEHLMDEKETTAQDRSGSLALSGPVSETCNAQNCINGECVQRKVDSLRPSKPDLITVCACHENWSGDSCTIYTMTASAQSTVSTPRCIPGCERHGVCRVTRRHHTTRHRFMSREYPIKNSDVSIYSLPMERENLQDSEGLLGFEDPNNDGICECSSGWTGTNCFISQCGPGNCNGGGECRESNDGTFICVCDAQHFGANCNYLRESSCDDGIDNDEDGLKDCEDSFECCSHPSCASNPVCVQSIVPRPPKSSSNFTNDFFQRVRFIFEAENSTDAETTQRYADAKNFDVRRLSVLRGRVLSRRGGPLTGVRVSDALNARYGFTITRGASGNSNENNYGGIFDLAVNGGETVELLFLRQPYAAVKRSFNVNANEIIDVGDIYLDEEQNERKIDSNSAVICNETIANFHRALRYEPKILTSNKKSATKSSVNLMLLGDYASYAPSLRVIHLSARIAGRVTNVSLSTRANLQHTFAWDRRNIYGIVERGKINAKVRIGYEYEGGESCHSILWHEFTVIFPSLS